MLHNSNEYNCAVPLFITGSQATVVNSKDLYQIQFYFLILHMTTLMNPFNDGLCVLEEQ